MAKQSKTDEESQDYPLARYFFLTYLHFDGNSHVYLKEKKIFIIIKRRRWKKHSLGYYYLPAYVLPHQKNFLKKIEQPHSAYRKKDLHYTSGKK